MVGFMFEPGTAPAIVLEKIRELYRPVDIELACVKSLEIVDALRNADVLALALPAQAKCPPKG